MEKPKILIISMAYLPRFVGGAEVAIKELTDRLGDEFEFHMVTLRYDSNLPRVSQEGSVTVHRIGLSLPGTTINDLRRPLFRALKAWFQLAAFFKAQSLNRTHQYKAVWGMMAHTAGVPAGLFKRFHPRLGYLLTLQEGDPPQHIKRQMRIFGPLFRAAFTRADRVQAISNFLGSWARDMGARDVRIVPNGVELSRFSKQVSPAQRSVLRQKMGAKEDEHLLVTVSRLVPKNGVDIVIEAMTMLPPRIKFAVIGDGPEYAYLKELAAMRGVSELVAFLGEVPNGEIHPYLAASDSFIRASRSEGQGIAFIEAMAAGLPTIGTNVGGIPDFLRDGETGFLISPESPETVASAVRRIVEQPIEANAIAEGGTRLAVERYSWGRIAEEMRAILRELL